MPNLLEKISGWFRSGRQAVVSEVEAEPVAVGSADADVGAEGERSTNAQVQGASDEPYP
jgi:hypothetical protein